MKERSAGEGLRLYLVGADEVLAEALYARCTPPDELFIRDAAETHRQLPQGAMDAVLAAWPVCAEARNAFDAIACAPRPVAVALVALCPDAAEAQVRALEAGADEAMRLPLCLSLLKARLAARRRLLQGKAALSALDGRALRVGPLCLDDAQQVITARGERLELTPKEFDFLSFLLHHAGACCTRDQILNNVWGIDFETGTNMVDVYVHFLRQKLRACDLPGLIRTVRGRGYRLVIPPPK